MKIVCTEGEKEGREEEGGRRNRIETRNNYVLFRVCYCLSLILFNRK